MPASFEISTGKPIEYHTTATLGALVQTAISNGYTADDVEERDITRDEYAAAVAVWEASDPETIAAKLKRDQDDALRESGLAKLYAQAGLTAEEIAAQR
jgi:hypothetical protein